MAIKLVPWEPEKYFTTPQAEFELLQDAYNEGHDGYIDSALDTVIKARALRKAKSEGTSNESQEAAATDQHGTGEADKE